MLGFRPEHAAMVAPGTPDSLEGEVYVVEPLGNETLITIALGDDLINLRAAAGVDPAIGTRIGLLPERSPAAPLRLGNRRRDPRGARTEGGARVNLATVHPTTAAIRASHRRSVA